MCVCVCARACWCVLWHHYARCIPPTQYAYVCECVCVYGISGMHHRAMYVLMTFLYFLVLSEDMIHMKGASSRCPHRPRIVFKLMIYHILLLVAVLPVLAHPHAMLPEKDRNTSLRTSDSSVCASICVYHTSVYHSMTPLPWITRPSTFRHAQQARSLHITTPSRHRSTAALSTSPRTAAPSTFAPDSSREGAGAHVQAL